MLLSLLLPTSKYFTNFIIQWENENVKFWFYSQAIIVERTVYVSGCLGLDKETLALVPGGAGPEMKKALENMKGILEAAGSSVDKVVKTMLFVTDLNDFGRVNEEYKKGCVFNYALEKYSFGDSLHQFNISHISLFHRRQRSHLIIHIHISTPNQTVFPVSVFAKNLPARSCVQIAKIGLDAKVELEVIGLTGDVEFKSISD